MVLKEKFLFELAISIAVPNFVTRLYIQEKLNALYIVIETLLVKIIGLDIIDTERSKTTGFTMISIFIFISLFILLSDLVFINSNFYGKQLHLIGALSR